MRVALDKLDIQVAALGPALRAARQAGQVLGRGDQISAALWPAAEREGNLPPRLGRR